MAGDRIAIVGSFDCGKSVLLSVLTYRFQKRTEDGFQIRPANQESINFCSENWSRLKQGDWPAPTPPAAKPPIYRWDICRGKKSRQIVTSDIAGEAWSSFVTKQVETTEEKDTKSIFESIKEQWNSLPNMLSPHGIETHITTVENMLKNASGIVLLLDLKLIINQESGYEQAMYLPTALVQYMKHIHRSHVPIILVLPKADEYQYEYELEGSWEKVVEKYVPWIPSFQTIIPVSAVSKTRHTFPAPDFESEGLEELCENIWGIMSSAGPKEVGRSILRFGYIDIPILLGIYVIYLLLVVILPVSSFAVWICSAFFWLSIVVYGLIKVIPFIVKHR